MSWHTWSQKYLRSIMLLQFKKITSLTNRISKNLSPAFFMSGSILGCCQPVSCARGALPFHCHGTFAASFIPRWSVKVRSEGSGDFLLGTGSLIWLFESDSNRIIQQDTPKSKGPSSLSLCNSIWGVLHLRPHPSRICLTKKWEMDWTFKPWCKIKQGKRAHDWGDTYFWFWGFRLQSSLSSFNNST